MRNLFSYDSRFMQILNLVADYMILNIFFLLTCLPLVTIGAAKTALYRVMFDMLEDKGRLFRKYFVTFWNELLTTIPLTLLKVGVSVFLVWEMLLVRMNNAPLATPVIIGLTLILILWSMVFSNLFPQIAVFRSTRREYLRNSLYIALSQLWRCLITMVFDLLPVFLFLWDPAFLGAVAPVWLFLYFSVTVNLGARLWRKPFAEYIRKFEEGDESP